MFKKLDVHDRGMSAIEITDLTKSFNGLRALIALT